MPRIGLALSGGSIRGAAHVGALKCLHDHGIKPDVVAGTSAGSVVAGLYASGLSPEDLVRVACELTPSKIFDIFSPIVVMAIFAKAVGEAMCGHARLLKWAPSGIMKGQKLEAFLRTKGIASSFEKMRLPCIVTAVEIDTGRKVLFTDRATAEKLNLRYKLRRSRTIAVCDVQPAEAIRASCAIPGLFVPKRINGMQLVDGGIKDNLPLEPIDLLGCDVLIGIDLGYSGERREGIDNIAEVVSQSIDIMAQQSVCLSAEMLRNRYRERLIRVLPRIYDVGLFDTGRIEECIDRGYQAMRKALPALLRITRAARRACFVGSVILEA